MKDKSRTMTILCPKCEEKVVGFLNELMAECKTFKRGHMIEDAIIDLWCCFEDGNLQRLRARDRKRKAGDKSVPRRLTPKSDFIRR